MLIKKKNNERRVTPLCFLQLLDCSREIKGNHLNVFKTLFFTICIKKYFILISIILINMFSTLKPIAIHLKWLKNEIKILK